MKEAQLDSFIRVAEYIVDFDDKEYEDYLDYCDSNSLDPMEDLGEMQRNHIYIVALRALNRPFEMRD